MTNNLEKILFYNMILLDKSEVRIWKKLNNGCYIGTMGYSEDNAKVLYILLKSFEEQYGEVITLDSAREELELYQNNGKLFIYFDEDMKPVSMCGITYNEDNVSVDFLAEDNRKLSSVYFYGLSTVHDYRGKGACRNLIGFVIEYAKYNEFDFIYARTDLINSNSEWIMEQSGMQVCMEDSKIIVEWVNVTDEKGDYRLHLWLPLKGDLYLESKEDALFADSDTRELLDNKMLKKDK